jgi:ABC-2 type transport system ATP-binding protein
MILVRDVSKKYRGQEVLHQLSFTIQKGEVVALLGPNGAGKSTLLKIISSYLSPTLGSVSIDGLDLNEHSLELRARLGYLPENVPLYTEMKVGEYLRYRAALKRVRSRRITEKVIDVLDLCGLRSHENRLIESLSKGYRQRVGLADALVNEPDLLILDEPTMGLDPMQQSNIQSLIANLAKRHTLIISTHSLKEAETLCKRHLILHNGRIVASGSLEELRNEFMLPSANLEEIFLLLTRKEEH